MIRLRDTAIFLCFCLMGFKIEPSCALSNRDLLACCQSKSVERKAICIAVLENTAQSLLFYRNLFDQQDAYLDICFPKKLIIEDLVKIYVAWIQERPQLLDAEAFLGATSAISTSYSCKKPKKKL